MKKNNNDLQHVCSFCKRNITIRSQYDMPIYDPQTGFAICKIVSKIFMDILLNMINVMKNLKIANS